MSIKNRLYCASNSIFIHITKKKKNKIKELQNIYKIILT